MNSPNTMRGWASIFLLSVLIVMGLASKALNLTLLRAVRYRSFESHIQEKAETRTDEDNSLCLSNDHSEVCTWSSNSSHRLQLLTRRQMLALLPPWVELAQSKVDCKNYVNPSPSLSMSYEVCRRDKLDFVESQIHLVGNQEIGVIQVNDEQPRLLSVHGDLVLNRVTSKGPLAIYTSGDLTVRGPLPPMIYLISAFGEIRLEKSTLSTAPLMLSDSQRHQLKLSKLPNFLVRVRNVLLWRTPIPSQAD